MKNIDTEANILNKSKFTSDCIALDIIKSFRNDRNFFCIIFIILRL